MRRGKPLDRGGSVVETGVSAQRGCYLPDSMAYIRRGDEGVPRVSCGLGEYAAGWSVHECARAPRRGPTIPAGKCCGSLDVHAERDECWSTGWTTQCCAYIPLGEQ